MKVFELLSEIEEIVDTSANVPLTGRIIVESEELLEIVKDIRDSLPDEIHQAQWIQEEKDRILTEAKKEYETVINEAKRRADDLVEKNEILLKTREAAEELMKKTEATIKRMKMGTYDYLDKILFDFQEKMEQLNTVYFENMYSELEKSFNSINSMIENNRSEIKDMAYRTQVGKDDISDPENDEEVK